MKRNTLLFAAAAAVCPLLVTAAPPAHTALPPPDIDAKGVESVVAPVSDAETVKPGMPDTVREYREKGKLRMLRIVPQKGPTQTYFDGNGDGRLDKDPLEGPVAPVYFTIYEWN